MRDGAGTAERIMRDMVDPAPLPEPLADRCFSVGLARANGVSPGRLRSSDLSAPFQGVRAPIPLTTVEALASAYAQRMRPGHVLAGVTAARLWGLPVRGRWREGDALVIGVPAGTARTRAKGVVAREFDATRFYACELDGLPILDPIGTVLMLARDVSHGDLVVLVDALVTPSWHYPDLRLTERPHRTIAQLETIAASWRGLHGAASFRAALARARSGADSPQESRARLAIVDAGLPEPVLQLEVRVAGVLQAVIDLAYPAWMIAVEYEGEHHLTDPVQWAKDIRRQELLESLGWIVIRATKEDLRHGGARLVRRIREAMRRRGCLAA